MSRTPKRYEIKKKGLAVIITKLKQEETKVIPEVFSNPNVIKPNYMKPIDARRKLDEMAKNKNVKVEEKNETKVTSIAPPVSIPSFSNFKDIKSFVEQKQKENSEKNKQILNRLKENKSEEPSIQKDEQDDINDLVNGNIQKEQKRIDDEYLKTLGIKTLNRLFKMVSGYMPNNNMTKYEIRKMILDKYKELPSSKNKLVYEASKLKDN